MKDRVFGVLQRIGRSFMLPIAILPVAGLLLGIGSSFTNETTIATYRLGAILGDGTLLHGLFVIMNRVGSAVFDNLPLLFAVGIAIGMSKKEKEVAALAAVISYLVMNTAINAMLTINGKILEDGTIAADVLEGTIASTCGIQSLQMGVFGGIIVGLGVAALHNRFYRTELPVALSFFGGTRFVPIVCTLVYMVVGILLYFLWPPVQSGIYGLGNLVSGLGYAGTLLHGLIKRALIPFGLHHVFYMPFWHTAVGGTMDVAGQLVQGGQNIFFAQLADSANVAHFSADATRYFSGEFIFMIFGLPGAALAMYHCARPEKKRAAGGLLLSASLTCILTGITEPIEFSFLFVAPALFVVQVILAGFAYMIAHMLNIAVGLTFSGGLLDFFLFGILQGNAKTSWIRVIPIGIIYFLLYYFIFRSLIRKFDFKTPGREDDDTETKLYTKADVNARRMENKGAGHPAGVESGENASLSERIMRGLGGKRNISDVDCCATRLRCTVHDASLVNDAMLKATGASGVVHKGKGVQIIYGPQVTVIKSDLEDYLEHVADEIEEKASSLSTDGRTEQNLSSRREDKAGKHSESRNTDMAGQYSGSQKYDIEASCSDGRQYDRVEQNAREQRYNGHSDDLRMREESTAAQDTDHQDSIVGKTVRTEIIYSPVTGTADDLGTVPDEAFAERMMGDGVAVTPTDGIVRAPADGTIYFVFETKHALGFKTDAGTSLLLHMGIDTVKLEGQGFDSFVNGGQRVKKGEPMLRINLGYVGANAPSLASPVICTELEPNQKIRLLQQGEVKAGDPLFAIDTLDER